MTSVAIQEINLLHANICQALADPRRILILYALDKQPLHVSALADELDVPQPTVSRHLRILREQSLVLTERDGPAVVYRIADRRIIEALNTMRRLMFDVLARQAGLVDAGTSAEHAGAISKRDPELT